MKITPLCPQERTPKFFRIPCPTRCFYRDCSAAPADVAFASNLCQWGTGAFSIDPECLFSSTPQPKWACIERLASRPSQDHAVRARSASRNRCRPSAPRKDSRLRGCARYHPERILPSLSISDFLRQCKKRSPVAQVRRSLRLQARR